MDHNDKNNGVGEKALSDIKKDFVAMGSHRVHGWYAWAIVGIVVGMAWGIVYVSSWSNQSATFDASHASEFKNMISPATVVLSELGELSETHIGELIRDYAQEQRINEIRIEPTSILVLDEKQVIAFDDGEIFPLLTTQGWQIFSTVLREKLNSIDPFELTINPGSTNYASYLVSGPTLPVQYSAYFVASGGGSRGGGYRDPQCVCGGSSVEYVISCSSGDEKHYIKGDGIGDNPWDPTDNIGDAHHFQIKIKTMKDAPCATKAPVCDVSKCKIAKPNTPNEDLQRPANNNFDFSSYCQVEVTNNQPPKDPRHGKCQDEPIETPKSTK